MKSFKFSNLFLITFLFSFFSFFVIINTAEAVATTESCAKELIESAECRDFKAREAFKTYPGTGSAPASTPSSSGGGVPEADIKAKCRPHPTNTTVASALPGPLQGAAALKARFWDNSSYICGDGPNAKAFECSGGNCKETKLNADTCGVFSSWRACLSDLADYLVGLLFWLVNKILSAILSIVSWLLDIVVYMTVVKFRSNFSDLNLNITGSVSLFGYDTGTISSGNIGSAIGIAGSGNNNLIYYLWGILRDFLNIIILITIVYSAVKTMFEGFSGQRDRFIYLLLFSIVMNFSLLLVKVAIDVSNILALQAYTLSVKPIGFDTWKNFTTRSDKAEPTNIGEYIMNSFNMAEINMVEIQSQAAKERIEEGMKKSWVFYAGQFAIYVGLIYLLIYILSMLLMRAAAFVFAMILAAFLAADLFFKVTGIENEEGGLGPTVRSVSGHIKDDFFDALVKGPVLFFFLFLLGVLANAIFTQGVAAEISKMTTESREFQMLGGAFASSITVFLKFAVFFALASFAFNKLNSLKLFGQGGGKRFGKYSSIMANKLFRPISAAPGFIGRNLIGRTLANPNNYLGGKWYQPLVKATGNLAAYQGRGSWMVRPLGRTLGRGLLKPINSSYELTKSKIANNVFNATGLNIEQSTAGSFSEEDKKRFDKRKTQVAEEAKVVGDLTRNVLMNKNQARKIARDDFGFGLYSLDSMKSMSDDAALNTAVTGFYNTNIKPIKDSIDLKSSQVERINTTLERTDLDPATRQRWLNQKKRLVGEIEQKRKDQDKIRFNQTVGDHAYNMSSSQISALNDFLNNKDKEGGPYSDFIEQYDNKNRLREVAEETAGGFAVGTEEKYKVGDNSSLIEASKDLASGARINKQIRFQAKRDVVDLANKSQVVSEGINLTERAIKDLQSILKTYTDTNGNSLLSGDIKTRVENEEITLRGLLAKVKGNPEYDPDEHDSPYGKLTAFEKYKSQIELQNALYNAGINASRTVQQALLDNPSQNKFSENLQDMKDELKTLEAKPKATLSAIERAKLKALRPKIATSESFANQNRDSDRMAKKLEEDVQAHKDKIDKLRTGAK